MPQVLETIPNAVATQAEVARAWFSENQQSEFKLTGIVDADGGLANESANTLGQAQELQLILCGQRDGQEVCLRERFLISPTSLGGREASARAREFEVVHIAEADEIASPAPLLDPPIGTRKGWIDAALEKHAFVVLVFYRGFW